MDASKTFSETEQNVVAAAEYTLGATEYNLFKRMKANATDEKARELKTAYLQDL